MPNILLLADFPDEKESRLIERARRSIAAKDFAAFESLCDWKGVDDSIRTFMKTEFQSLSESTIHSIKLAPLNFRGEMFHWSAYQYYQPNLSVIGYMDIEYTPAGDQVAGNEILSLEMGDAGDDFRLINYTETGERNLPKGSVKGLSIRGHTEQLADRTFLLTSLITNPGSLISAHLANEEIWQRDYNNTRKTRRINSAPLTFLVGEESQESKQPSTTLPRRYALTFELVDADSDQPIQNAAALYKEDESTWFGNGDNDYETGASWETFQVIEDGQTAFHANTSLVMNQAHVRVFSTGYAAVYLKLDENLERGKRLVKPVRMKAVAPIELSIKTAGAVPATGATFETHQPSELRVALRGRGSEGLKRLLAIEAKTDERGIAIFPQPAFAEWASYRIQHSTGHVEFRMGVVLPTVDGAAFAKLDLKLLANGIIRGRYLPKVLENEFLEIYRLQSNRMKVDRPADVVELDNEGRFTLSPRLAGWHSLVHRVRHTDADGNVGTDAIANIHGRVRSEKKSNHRERVEDAQY